MLMVAVIINLFVAFGLVALSTKYLFGPAPADYHAEILVAGGIEITGPLPGVFKAANTVIGSGFLSIALGSAALVWFGVQADLLWAKFAVLAMALLAGIPSSEIARRLEKATGVKTPWRPGFAMTGLSLAAFFLAIV